MRPAGSRPRIFIGPVEVSGYYGALAASLERQGYPVTFVDLGPGKYGFPSPPLRSPVPRLARWTWRRFHASRSAARPLWRLGAWAMRAALLGWVLATADVIVLAHGGSLARWRDLALMRALGKRIISVFNGSDARPPYMDGAWVRPGAVPAAEDLAALTAARADAVRRSEQGSDVIVAHPLYAQFLTRPFVQFLAVGLPTPVPSEVPRSDEHGEIRFVHAPSDPILKGSARIREAVDRLSADGVPVAYREIVGAPHHEVLAALEWADVAIDQLYSDLPWSVFAAEAGARGRPAVVGGYGWDAMEAAVPPGLAAPGIRCAPEDLDATLAGVVADRDRARRIGSAARTFAEGNLGETAGRRFAQIIEGDIPDDWWADPLDTAYPFGCGVTPALVSEAVSRVVAAGGPAALRLEHNPILRDRLVELAGQGRPPA